MTQSFKNILVVGATSAMAQEAARCFALRYEANFVLVARSKEKLTAFSEDLKARGAAAVHLVVGNLLDEKVHTEIVSESFEIFEQIDLTLMAWGDLGDEDKAQVDYSAAKHILDVNFNSVVSLLTKLVEPYERQKRGTIAVISSVAGDRGRRPNYTYGSSKAALTAYLQGFRSRMYCSGVKVVNIKPGQVSTPMTSHMEQGAMFAQPEKVGEDIYRGIVKGRDEFYTPSFWRLIMLIIRNIPEVLFKRMNV